MTPDAQELLAIAAHDIRNPLMCIEGYAQLLLRQDLPAEERAKLLERILSCSRFAGQIVGDVLDTSALDHGQLAVRKEAVALADVVAGALEALEHAASSRGVRVAFEGAAGALPVLADPARIQQVLHNLIGNALKHVQPETGRVAVRLREQGSELLVEVVDNG
ncbi:MAG: HAMP domain-containing histidine kinase, partial [Elusimicrobia bacterium]|nr:HAMP domain-containing histidine kinase [Elusimicrobiota bacterium]